MRMTVCHRLQQSSDPLVVTRALLRTEKVGACGDPQGLLPVLAYRTFYVTFFPDGLTFFFL